MRKRARTVLCGGRSAMVVPTATGMSAAPPHAAALPAGPMYEWRVIGSEWHSGGGRHGAREVLEIGKVAENT
ncbi:MAG: hypothetical protein ABSE57_31855 [Bryobacteraceae bacterium]|jgi:hypothetical protein